jgi:hypothetical protein
MAILARVAEGRRFLFIFRQPAFQVAERIAAQREIVFDNPGGAEAAAVVAAAFDRVFRNRLGQRNEYSPSCRFEVAARRRRPARFWQSRRFRRGLGESVNPGDLRLVSRGFACRRKKTARSEATARRWGEIGKQARRRTRRLPCPALGLVGPYER